MTQLDLFWMTVRHQPRPEFLFYASATANLNMQLEEHIRSCMQKSHGFEHQHGPVSPEEIGKPEIPGIAEYFGMYIPVPIHPKSDAFEQDFSRYFEKIDRPEGSFINSIGVLEIPTGFHHFTRYVSPLRNAKSIKDFEDFPFPSAYNMNGSEMDAKVIETHAMGKVAMAPVGHMYETAWEIRGYEEFLQDMIKQPAWAEYILDRITERNIALAAAGAGAGADFIFTGDDVANQNSLMFSPVMWRKFIKARWEKAYSAARSIRPDIQIWYHSDGNIEPIIPELIEIGVTILNPLQPECLNLAKMKKEYGRHLVFEGTIGTQSTMPFGTPEEVKCVVHERKKTLGYDGALILAPTHILEPEVSVANVLAFIEACKEE